MFINTPDLLLDELMLSSETSVFLLVSFERLLTFLQFTVFSSCRLLFMPQGVAEGADVLLVTVELSQPQLQAVLVKVVHQRLVPLRLGKVRGGGTVN